MKKLLLLTVISMFSIGAWANDYKYCNSIDLSELDNLKLSECADKLNAEHLRKMNSILNTIYLSKTIDPKLRNITKQSQVAFNSYKKIQCSYFDENQGASALSNINKELCESGMNKQRSEVLESILP